MRFQFFLFSISCKVHSPGPELSGAGSGRCRPSVRIVCGCPPRCRCNGSDAEGPPSAAQVPLRSKVMPPAGSVVLWADGCIVSASFRVHRRVLPPAGSVVLWADGCIVSTSFRVHRRVLPPAGSVVLRADGCIVSALFRGTSPGPAACGNRSLVRGDGINRRDGPMHPEGGRLRSGEPSRKRAPEHPVPSDDGERAGIAVRPKKIGTARERQPRPQTPAKELI